MVSHSERVTLEAERRAVIDAAVEWWKTDSNPFIPALQEHVLNVGVHVYNVRLMTHGIPIIDSVDLRVANSYMRAPVTLREVNLFVKATFRVRLTWAKSTVHDRALVTRLPMPPRPVPPVTTPPANLNFNAVFYLPALEKAAASKNHAKYLALKAERQSIIEASKAKWEADPARFKDASREQPQDFALFVYSLRLMTHGINRIRRSELHSTPAYLGVPLTLKQATDFAIAYYTIRPAWKKSPDHPRALVAHIPNLPQMRSSNDNVIFYLPDE